MKILDFNDRLECCICSSKDVFRINMDEKLCYCKRHVPKEHREKIGKYSGPSHRIKGAYEKDGEE